MKKLQVICFYWEGERWPTTISENTISTDPQYRRMLQRAGPVSTELSAKYVNNLFAGVTRFADRDFDFICFTNEDLDLDPGIEVRKFPMITQRGVLPRLYMFSEDSGLFGHQVLCFDLDVVVVGGLGPLMSYSGLFCARSKFKYGEEEKLDGDIMSFRAGPEAEARFWLPFIADVNQAVAFTQGRERYWVRHVANDVADRWDKLSPGAVLSYKRHLYTSDRVPVGTCIVSCHGFPRPHQAKAGWVKEYWK
jgi:hypothetical protein